MTIENRSAIVLDVKRNIHLDILKYHREGRSPGEIAVLTGVPVAAVENILASPLARAEIARAG